MVVFTCNNCGTSIAKPKAERHIQSCKNNYGMVSLCCVDCLKDFNEVTFREHIKCMTELERYSAPGFVPKPSSNKGERKQTSWIECIRMTAEKPGLNRNMKSAINVIARYNNVPRNKAKFENFIRNSCNSLRNYDLSSVFHLIDTTFKEELIKNAANTDKKQTNVDDDGTTTTTTTNINNINNSNNNFNVSEDSTAAERELTNDKSTEIVEQKRTDNVAAPKKKKKKQSLEQRDDGDLYCVVDNAAARDTENDIDEKVNGIASRKNEVIKNVENSNRDRTNTKRKHEEDFELMKLAEGEDAAAAIIIGKRKRKKIATSSTTTITIAEKLAENILTGAPPPETGTEETNVVNGDVARKKIKSRKRTASSLSNSSHDEHDRNEDVIVETAEPFISESSLPVCNNDLLNNDLLKSEKKIKMKRKADDESVAEKEQQEDEVNLQTNQIVNNNNDIIAKSRQQSVLKLNNDVDLGKKLKKKRKTGDVDEPAAEISRNRSSNICITSDQSDDDAAIVKIKEQSPSELQMRNNVSDFVVSKKKKSKRLSIPSCSLHVCDDTEIKTDSKNKTKRCGGSVVEVNGNRSNNDDDGGGISAAERTSQSYVTNKLTFLDGENEELTEEQYVDKVIASGGKFPWRKTVASILSANPSGRMKVNRLCGKVVRLYRKYRPDSSDERAREIFRRKLNENDQKMEKLGYKIELLKDDFVHCTYVGGGGSG